jgi:hypothetical protein
LDTPTASKTVAVTRLLITIAHATSVNFVCDAAWLAGVFIGNLLSWKAFGPQPHEGCRPVIEVFLQYPEVPAFMPTLPNKCPLLDSRADPKPLEGLIERINPLGPDAHLVQLISV